jgi:hypothetical protein
MAEEKSNSFTQLFYPWFFGGELKGQIENYINGDKGYLDTFKHELIRLYQEFSQPPEENTIYILNIGANCTDDDLPCWHRELPNFILNGLLTNTKIKLLLVDNFKEGYVPKTVRRNRDYASKTETGWIVEDMNMEIKMFRTFFPSFYETRKAYFPVSKQYKTIEERRSLSEDREFIDSFYSKLEQFTERLCQVGSMFIVISTASFKYDNVTESIDYQGKKFSEGNGNRTLELYPELINIIQPSTSDCFYLFVWAFESEYVQLFGSNVRLKYHEDPLYDTPQINIDKINDKLVLIPVKKDIRDKFKNSRSPIYTVVKRK